MQHDGDFPRRRPVLGRITTRSSTGEDCRVDRPARSDRRTRRRGESRSERVAAVAKRLISACKSSSPLWFPLFLSAPCRSFSARFSSWFVSARRDAQLLPALSLSRSHLVSGCRSASSEKSDTLRWLTSPIQDADVNMRSLRCRIVNDTPWRLVPTIVYFESGRFASPPPIIVEPRSVAFFSVTQRDWSLAGVSGGLAMQVMIDEGDQPRLDFSIVRWCQPSADDLSDESFDTTGLRADFLSRGITVIIYGDRLASVRLRKSIGVAGKGRHRLGTLVEVSSVGVVPARRVVWWRAVRERA